MIEEFDDFCLHMFVIVDDIWKDIAPIFKRPGPNDSELLTMVLVGECRGWELETKLLSHWQEHATCFLLSRRIATLIDADDTYIRLSTRSGRQF